MRRSIGFTLLFLTALAARADEDLAVKEAGLEDRRGESWIVVRGQCSLPERARLTATLAYQGREAKGFHASGYVSEGGTWTIELGPLEQRLLPGKYTTIVGFSLGEQHPVIRQILKSSGEIKPARLLEPLPFTVGTPQEEATAREEQIRAYTAILDQIAQTIAQFLPGHQALEQGEKFLDPTKKVDPEAWGPWVDGMLAVVEQIDQQRERLESAVLAPMFPQTHEFASSSIDVCRQVLLAVTRNLYQKAGVPIPERYEQPERFQNLFSNPKLLELKLEDVKKAKALLEAGSEDQPVTVGGSGKTRAEEMKDIQALVTQRLVQVEAARRILQEKIASLGGTLGDPKGFEEWYRTWVDQLGKARPRREVVQLTTKMTPEALIGLKYPYLWDLVEEVVHDLSGVAAIEAIRLYLAAKQEIPAHHLKPDVPAAELTLERVNADLKTHQGIYQVRLGHVCGLLEIELPK